MTLRNRLHDVEARLEQACLRSGRQRGDVRIIAVTKYVSVATAEAAVREGITHIGENRWPDAKAKWDALQGQALFHYIGSLQTNKVKDVVGKFDYIHSLDRMSLAEAIQGRAEKLDIQVPCLLQVNVSGEESKHGLAPEQVRSFLADLRKMNRIRPIGLMTMAPYESEPHATRPVFRALRALRDELNCMELTDEPITELSMGMSNDFEIAVEEGATMVRLGTVLVGKEEIGEG
ncbi:YggS family pyridoxal phosphate-dependent enzyme [Cohnella endophytica]|uniref:Pyridoxal phosphate homeostasis protein n=1 Tax=Cohnella endophytica TaxID=2419778 RepID=A0A494XXR4_9BACL|nr:YggS family pyridoxal phosphate-dependent enzyme [Cohnella endophytica]RKP55282.1 YggS family pyridoxal phosphate-dependent enzyme [Cohnella endophytica]